MNQFEKNLLAHARNLPADARQSLLDYAEFLASKSAKPEIPALNPLPRPEKESVVKAIQRLSRTYPMLPKETLLHETSDKMSEHVLKGKPASEVIDELEEIFAAHYSRFLEAQQ